MANEPFQNGHALIIGVGGDLKETVADARGIQQILTNPERVGYPAGQVMLLTESQATRHGMLSALDKLATRMQQAGNGDATVLIYYSGHGGYDKQQPGAPFYFLTNGYQTDDFAGTCVSAAEFSQKLDQIPAQKLVVILDCCHAGEIKAKEAGREALEADELLSAPQLRQDNTKMVHELDRGSGRIVLASSTGKQVSFIGEQGLSIFTECLIEALQGKNTEKEDPYISFGDVWDYLGREVPKRSQAKYQETQDPVINAREMTFFYLGRNKVEAIPEIPRVFIISSPKDETFLKALQKQIGLLVKAGVIEKYDPGDLIPGYSIMDTLEEELNKAQIAVPLVSPDFFDSDRWPTLLEKAHDRGLRLLPVVVRDIFYEIDPILGDENLAKFPVENGEVKPVAAWGDQQDKALKSVAIELVKLAKKIKAGG